MKTTISSESFIIQIAMKKIVLFLFSWSLICFSCSMDDIPLEDMPPEVAYRDSFRVEMFVNELYAYINTGQTYNRIGAGGTGGAMFDCATDIGVYSPVNNQAALLNYTNALMNQHSSGNPDSRWAECYTGIRKANIFLKYIHLSNMSDSRKNRMIGEALLHKALLHFELVKRFGGIPIMDDLLDLSGDINIPRGTYEECVEYIVGLCDRAAELLPTRYPINDYGRLTKGAAYGLKAKILLYAASPLVNEDPIPGATIYQRYESPNKDRWKRAADAALQVMQLRNPDGTPAHELYPDYQQFFFTKERNYEGLIMRMNTSTNAVDKANGPSGYQGARGNTNLTLEFVNMFEMQSTGLLPHEDPDYDPQKPYEGRDKRFYSIVLYNGVELWGRQVETYKGGLDYPSAAGQKGCVTGFTMFKHIDPKVSIVAPEIKTFHDFPVLRYADILLIYAECMNEYLGLGDDDLVNDDLIYTCVNDIRSRGELLPASDLTKGEMRELIHRERTIELSFEESRYYDLKRWRQAETVLNRPVHGVVIEKSGDDFEYKYEIDGKPIVVENRKFDARMYFYPIPQTEMDKNKALVQNWGW